VLTVGRQTHRKAGDQKITAVNRVEYWLEKLPDIATGPTIKDPA
jgi:hypothetical protein